MKVIPLYDRVVLKNIEQKKEKIGNIILPESAQVLPVLSEVVAIGTGGKIGGNSIEFQVKVGDNVLYNKYSANDFTIDNQTFTIIKEIDILAIVERGENNETNN